MPSDQGRAASGSDNSSRLSKHDRQLRSKGPERSNSRLGVVVVWVHIDVPQAQLMQLANDFLHGVHVLVGHSIQGTGTGGGSRLLGVGEVQQPRVACAGNDLVPVLGSQVRVPAPAKPVEHTTYNDMQGQLNDTISSIPLPALYHVQAGLSAKVKNSFAQHSSAKCNYRLNNITAGSRRFVSVMGNCNTACLGLCTAASNNYQLL